MPPPWLLVKVEFCERAMQLIEILEYFKGWSLNAPPEFQGIKTQIRGFVARVYYA